MPSLRRVSPNRDSLQRNDRRDVSTPALVPNPNPTPPTSSSTRAKAALRAWLVGAALTVVSTLSPSAKADGLFPPYGEPFKFDKVNVYDRTVRWEVMRQAGFTSARVFGAVGAFDKYVRPALSTPIAGGDTQLAGGLEYNVVLNAAHAVGRCGMPECETLHDKEVLLALDLYNSSFAFMYGGPVVGLFAAGSYTLPAISGPGLNRGLMGYETVMGPVLVYGLWWLRLFGKKAFSYVLPGSMEGVAGGYLRAGPINATAGYILSQGLFADISAPRFSPFATAAVSDQLEQTSLLKGGLRYFDYFGTRVTQTIGQTSVFARRLLLNPPRSVLGSVNPVDDLSDASANAKIPLLTGHFEQTDIMQLVDIRLAYATKPTPVLHEARVGVHTPRYNAIQARSGISEKGSNSPIGLSLTMGMVQFPDLFYYGVQGGKRFSFALEGGMVSEGLVVKSFVRFNDPELLTPFPYAYNALNFGLSFSGSGSAR